MHDLRRQALESGKTVSRKARSRQASRANSRSNSPAPAPGSRGASSLNVTPAGSDDGYSDNSSLGIASGNASSDEDSTQGPAVSLPEQSLSETIDNLLDKSTKRQNAATRLVNLALYCNSRIARRPDEERAVDAGGREAQLAIALLKMIKTERSEEEALLALHALALTVVSSTAFSRAGGGASSAYEEAASTLKRTISSSPFVTVKAAAVRALSTFAFYAGVADEEITDTLAYFLDIIITDGASIEALDAPGPVCAAIQEFAFLLTRFDDWEDDSNDAVEALLDQLTSSDPDVQVAAGEAIALLYEMSFTPLEDDEEADDVPDQDDVYQDGADDDSFGGGGGATLVRRYPAYRRTDEVESQLDALVRATFHNLSQKKKRAVHAMAADVLDSVRHPTHGPRYQNALDLSNHAIGSSMRVVVNNGAAGKGRRAGSSVIYVDAWWKLARYQHLVRVLKGGFNQHYLGNQLVAESLPGEAGFDDDDDGGFSAKQYAKAVKGKKTAMNMYSRNDPWEQ